MKKVVFSKYNRTRKKEYRICTAIYEDASERKVEKRALCPEAVEHIYSLKEKSAKMEDVYENIRILQPVIEDQAAVYPYLDGITADGQLRVYIKNPENLLIELKKKNELFFAVKKEKICDFYE